MTDIATLRTHKPVMVPKGWGYELIFWNDENYCGKLLHFVAGRQCSFHFHARKDECFYVHSGKIRLEVEVPDAGIGIQMFTLEAGNCFHIKPGVIHRVYALERSDVFEFSTHDDPEDSIRLMKGD